MYLHNTVFEKKTKGKVNDYLKMNIHINIDFLWIIFNVCNSLNSILNETIFSNLYSE